MYIPTSKSCLSKVIVGTVGGDLPNEDACWVVLPRMLQISFTVCQEEDYKKEELQDLVI